MNRWATGRWVWLGSCADRLHAVIFVGSGVQTSSQVHQVGAALRHVGRHTVTGRSPFDGPQPSAFGQTGHKKHLRWNAGVFDEGVPNWRPALARAQAMDGKLLLGTNVQDLTPGEVVRRYKALADIERGFWVLKSEIEIAPVFHRLPPTSEDQWQRLVTGVCTG